MVLPILAETALARTIEISAIPAPTFQEAERATRVSNWLSADGLTPVVDAAGNVRAQIREGNGRALAVCAHLDTVFGSEIPHGAEVVGDRLFGPSVGDNSVGIAALTLLHRALPVDLDMPLWIVATTGEEGLGNLAGARHLCNDEELALGQLIAVEGNYLGRVVRKGVGSVRWQIVIDGPGGHAWESSHAPSAVHEMARLATQLADLRLGSSARSSINVGVAQGGEAINARARRAEMWIDLRSDDQTVLDELSGAVRGIVESSSDELVTRLNEKGRRSAGSINYDHTLVKAALAGLASVGLEPKHPSASTDANAAYAAGIPAVTLGITTGSGEHTPQEWIDIPAIEDGMNALVATIKAVSREAA